MSDYDYLVIGSGASGLSFVDTLIEEDPDARVLIVDKHDRPGGHWNDAYSFVTLHQPSAFYGVNSLELCDGRIDESGPNEGMWGLATGAEVSAYFERVMRDRLIPSGRVEYRPLSEYLGDGRLRSVVSGDEERVEYRKLVDSSYYGTTVPSTHTPKFAVEDGARLLTPNALPGLWKEEGRAPGFVILGAGKTAMDVGLWLLDAGVAPDDIIWVRPRDAWVLNRATLQPGIEFFDSTIGGQAALFAAQGRASDAEDLFDRMEASGLVLRIDPDHRPEMFHYATCSVAEVERLRDIANVVRRGHVRAISPASMRFDDGDLQVPDGSLFIDCTATAVTRRPPIPLFAKDRITLQMIRIPQPAFSAALTGFIEANYDDDERKNALARPIPLPDKVSEYPLASLVNLVNQAAWSQEPEIRQWLKSARLDGFQKMISDIPPDDEQKRALLGSMREKIALAFGNLQKLSQSA